MNLIGLHKTELSEAQWHFVSASIELGFDDHGFVVKASEAA